MKSCRWQFLGAALALAGAAGLAAFLTRTGS